MTKDDLINILTEFECDSRRKRLTLFNKKNKIKYQIAYGYHMFFILMIDEKINVQSWCFKDAIRWFRHKDNFKNLKGRVIFD